MCMFFSADSLPILCHSIIKDEKRKLAHRNLPEQSPGKQFSYRPFPVHFSEYGDEKWKEKTKRWADVMKNQFQWNPSTVDDSAKLLSNLSECEY